MSSVKNAQDSELAIVNINIGEVEESENDTFQPHNKPRKMTSMFKGQESDDTINVTNVGEVNEGFESDAETVQPKPVIIWKIDGNEGKQGFFILYIKWTKFRVAVKHKRLREILINIPLINHTKFYMQNLKIFFT